LIIDDIIWLDRIVEKLAWKHNVLPSEVEEVDLEIVRYIRKKRAGLKENICTMHWATQNPGVISRYFLLKNLKTKRLLLLPGI
jgi:hypothetical protein